MPPLANLLSLEKVSKSYGVRILLDEVSLGVGEGERIGIVGRNGDGKTTLLNLMAGRETPDTGRISRNRGLHIGYLDQRDLLDDEHTVREVVLDGREEHEWAADSRTREVVEVLLAGVALDRVVHGLSGGERRRCSLARLLLNDDDLLILDEPTNHLDVEAVAWLADHLVRRTSALVVVTHDRWFLDAVCERTWEVHPGLDGAGVVDSYEGGYAAFVLAKAERHATGLGLRAAPAEPDAQGARLAASRPAGAHLEAEVPHRRGQRPDRRRARRRATGSRCRRSPPSAWARTSSTSSTSTSPAASKQLLRDATWRLGPGDRVGIVGVNGAGKSSVLALVSGALEPDAGRVKRGRTIALEHLTQHVPVEDPDARVLPSIEDIRRVTRLSTGKDVSASSMLERFGFTGDKLTARLGDLSGGERRRFQLLKLLLSEPNVLLLDEPTNDLDIETLNVVEDFLDGWPGTLIVVSHDRYFLERVTDSVWALMGDGQIAMLPRGVDEYLESRRSSCRSRAGVEQASDGARPTAKAKVGGADERQARKDVARIDKQLARITVARGGGHRRDGHERRRRPAQGALRGDAPARRRARQSSRRSGSRQLHCSSEPLS